MSYAQFFVIQYFLFSAKWDSVVEYQLETLVRIVAYSFLPGRVLHVHTSQAFCALKRAGAQLAGARFAVLLKLYAVRH
jgi:hypothetical protein